MIYEFSCPGRDHKGDRDFSKIMHGIPPKVVVNQIDCPECGATAKRRFDKEIPTQSVVGMTPISNSTTTPGSFQRTVQRAFGSYQKNPDGSVDPNHAAFRDSGELDRFMNGANQLGKPKIDQRTGQPLRRKDGSVIREGAKIFKYDRSATPSRDDVRRRPRPSRNIDWVDDRTAKEFPDTK